MNQVEKLTVRRKASLRAALSQMDQSGAGLLMLVDDDGRFLRTLTDGDLRRLLLKGVALEDSLECVPDVRSHVIPEGTARRDALETMNRHGIDHLPVVDADGRVIAVLTRKEIDAQILLSTPHMGEAERDFVEEAFRTNWIAPLGPNVDAFERELAELVGIRHAAAMSSGTAALHVALRLLGVGSGDKVFCSTLTFAASANPITFAAAAWHFL